MTEHNSLVEFYSALSQRLLTDAAVRFGVPSSELERDLDTVKARVESEGIEFLTKTLPELGKLLDECLHSNNARFAPEGWETIPGTTSPKFMGWAWQALFTDQGQLEYPSEGTSQLAYDVQQERYRVSGTSFVVHTFLDSVPHGDRIALRRAFSFESDEQAFAGLIAATRQILYAMYKLELPYEEHQCTKVLDDFVSTDQSLQSPDDSVVSRAWLKTARALITSVCSGFDHRDILPRHGPGAVATGERLHEKFSFRRLYQSIERVYPFTEYFVFSLSHVVDECPEYTESLEVLHAPTAKVVLVPKDSRGPRLISSEPLEVQWIQQGLGNKLRDHIERHRLTRGRVNFTRQSINQNLALKGSKTGRWVTLDMKEASDRVSNELVNNLFAGTQLLEALQASRSVATRLPDGRYVALKKFAPMGSNLCFPVESLVFWALSVSALMTQRGISRREAVNSVYVYGDDIVVRLKDCETVLHYLPKAGLVFNQGKCCCEGLFRESCGMEAWYSYDVTPVRFRTVWRHDRVTAGVVASHIAYRNALKRSGYWLTAEMLEEELQKLFARNGLEPIPYYPVSGLSGEPVSCLWPLEKVPQQRFRSSLGFQDDPDSAAWNNANYRVRTRYNRNTMNHEIRGYKLRVKNSYRKVSGWRELLGRCHLEALADTAWWEPGDVVREQLREALAMKRQQGVLPDPRRLTLTSGWTSLF